MVKASPAPAFVVAEPQLLLELLIIPLNAPAQFGRVNQLADCDRLRQGRKPVSDWLRLTFRPLDEQPLLWPGLRAPVVAVRRSNAKRRVTVLTGRPLVASRTLAVSSHTAVEEEPAAASPLIV